MNNSCQTKMNEIAVHPKDIRKYRKLIMLARGQLASIQRRLASDPGKLDKWKFLFRNLKLKKTILKILKAKESRIGEQGLAEMMDDYRAIEASWQDVEKDELDYIRMMVHGLRDVREEQEQGQE